MNLRTLATLGALATLVGCSEYELVGGDDIGSPNDVDDTGSAEIPDGEPVGGIHGRVCAPDGATWVVGADVTATHAWGTTTATTGADGWFLMEELPIGFYEVVITKGSFSATFEVEVFEDEVTELAANECLEQGDVKIAVITGIYDHIESVLDGLSLTYDTIDGNYGGQFAQFMSDPATLEQYDIIFFNCGLSSNWTAHQQIVSKNLSDYVAQGGSVYASDWAYFLIEVSFPHHNTYIGDDTLPGAAYVGESGIIIGDVIDPNIAGVLASNTAVLDYNLPSWAAVERTDNGDILIEGPYSYLDPSTYTYSTRVGPLATRYTDGHGSAVYTSFHNEAQTTVDMILILQEIILSL